ncbi:MAG: hypothetical protein DWQ37_11855 [Planctomycetota bacterium]|nr:MAG: hypothetical protein DWQ37_11855 [Planctomycetota bacterium]
MATYLFAWELGFGLGHLVNLKPLVAGLHQRGHTVALAIRDLTRAWTFFPHDRVTLWQAPFKNRTTQRKFPTLSFAHVLYDAGFCDPVELQGHGEAWRNLYRAVDPDVIVFDHSPTALLAARGFRAKRVTLGTGFFCPLDVSPLPTLQPWLKPDPVQLAHDEQEVLNNANAVLAAWSEPPLGHLAGLYHPSDEHLLVTFAELDHYGGRAGAHYWGAWSTGFGKPPEWPAAPGKKIYAYLKPFPELSALLGALHRAACPTIVYCDGIAADVQNQFRSPTLRFENEPLDMTRVGRKCDLAILNANHGTAVQILLAGKPSLQIPIYVEQSLLAGAMMRMGAALGASPAVAREIEVQLHRLISSDCCVEAARGFADKYRNFEPERQITGIVDRLEALGKA